MTDDVSKLPAWPEDLKPGSIGGHEEFVWLDDTLTAALARMEALVEFAEHGEDCAMWRSESEGGRWLCDSAPCTCGLSELLAACERKEAGR